MDGSATSDDEFDGEAVLQNFKKIVVALPLFATTPASLPSPLRLIWSEHAARMSRYSNDYDVVLLVQTAEGESQSDDSDGSVW